MKKLHRLCMAVLLTLVLTTCSFAGDIGIPGAPPSQPPSSSTTPGDILTPPGDTQGPSGLASDAVTEAALNLLQSVLLVF